MVFARAAEGIRLAGWLAWLPRAAFAPALPLRSFFMLAFLASPAEVEAGGRTPVTFLVHASVPVRVQIALSPSGVQPCDSSDNVMVFDGMIDPRAGLTFRLDPLPLCVRHTYDDFPESNWGRSELWFRRATIVLEAHADPEGRSQP